MRFQIEVKSDYRFLNFLLKTENLQSVDLFRDIYKLSTYISAKFIRENSKNHNFTAFSPIGLNLDKK